MGEVLSSHAGALRCSPCGASRRCRVLVAPGCCQADVLVRAAERRSTPPEREGGGQVRGGQARGCTCPGGSLHAFIQIPAGSMVGHRGTIRNRATLTATNTGPRRVYARSTEYSEAPHPSERAGRFASAAISR